MHLDESTLWVPLTEHDRDLVREQMQRLLETSHFRNSRRYPALLRFIVEETLDGRGEFLKERLLGVRVFGRPSDYDTAADPVVRVTVAEIRKRIAQYYHDESHDDELRIELLPGRYEPEFRLGRNHLAPESNADQAAHHEAQMHAVSAPAAPDAAVTPAPAVYAPAAATHPSRRYLYLLGAVVVLLATAGAVWPMLHPSAGDQLWAPLLASHRVVTMCMPVAGGKYGVAADSKVKLPSAIQALPSSTGSTVVPETYLALESLGENTVFSDVRAENRVSNELALRHAEQHLRLNTTVTLDDLRQGPAVLIGGMDNQWTLRVMSRLRYQFGGNDSEYYWITDSKSAQPTGWGLDVKTPITAVTRDYAIVARVHDENTGQVVVLLAGIGMSGTAAAGELLTDPAQVEELRRRVGPGFRDRDFEAVLSTDVVNGIAGSAKVLTVEVQ